MSDTIEGIVVQVSHKVSDRIESTGCCRISYRSALS